MLSRINWKCASMFAALWCLATGHQLPAAPHGPPGPDPVAVAAAEKSTATLPPLAPLFDYPLRDTSICVGGDGAYYLTGTTDGPDWWSVSENIRVWRSTDLKTWQPVVARPHARSVVWNVDRDGGAWEKPIHTRDGAPFRPLWAPEIAYLKGTYWICYSLPDGIGGGILKSTSGRAEGPYERMFKTGPAVSGIDLALFADDDGKVYLLWRAGKIRQLNEQMNGFVGEEWTLKPANSNRIGFEGTFLFKRGGKYYITGAEFVPDRQGRRQYACFAAVGDSVHGPFGDKYLAIPHGGHNSFFVDHDGQWWATIFGNSAGAPFVERPGILRITFDQDGRFFPAPVQPDFVLRH